MATTRPSRAAQPTRAARPNRVAERRAREASEGRAERRIYLAAAIIGLAVFVIVAAGVILTVVMPPRSTVVKVGDRSFTARELAIRVKHAVIVESNSALVTDPAGGVPILAREEVLRQKSGELGVSEVTDDDVVQAIRKRLGVAPEKSAEAFQADYAQFISARNYDRADFEYVVRAGVLREKATAAFKTKVPEAGPQLHIMGVSNPDPQKVEGLRAAVAAGKDFKAEAFARGLVEEPDQADLSWINPNGLPESLAPIGKLNAGDLSGVIVDPRTGTAFFAKVIEREESRKYAESMVDQVAGQMLLDWLKQQEAALVGPTTLTSTAKAWVERQVKDALAEAQRRAQAQQAAK